jgi:hypothetical protein
MFQLITALAKAHSAILSFPEIDNNLASTARKIEATMVDHIKACSEQEKSKLVGAVMNSGSLKSLKLIPETARATPYCGSAFHYPIADFIINQSPAYIREAMKRGFYLEDGQRLDIFQEILDNPEDESRKQKETLLLNLAPKGRNRSPAYFAEMVIKALIEHKGPSDSVGPLALRILKNCAKTDKDKMVSSFERFLGIHDPAAASEFLYREIATYAMLGVPKPAKTIFENDEMERLAKTITTASGRRALIEEVGGLEKWLSGGHQNPPKIIAEFEQKRQNWYSPRSITNRSVAVRRNW